MVVPTVRFNNGRDFPVIGVGTFQAGKPGEVVAVLKDAIDVGFRHIDGAMYYENEAEVGSAIRDKINEGLIKREDLFVTSKLWNNFHRPDLVVSTCKKSLSDLGLDYVDLYLIHWPFAVKEGDIFDPVDEEGKLIPNDVDYVDTWKAMEECVKLGLAKSIGLSNFNSQQIQRVLDVATIKPVVNQVECHPYLNQSKLLDFCKERGILLTAYSPLGSPGILAKPDTPAPLKDPRIAEVAKKHGKTVAQTILRYMIQHGVVPIPKSSNKQRLEENFNIFGFKLTPEEVAYIDSVNKNFRIFLFDKASNHKDYPFNIEF
ncbi:aldose reductase-like isoform X2 [Zootermopsis nevadensis]|uniref:aldose reductase-like isoform X2 n=1 Tax=Zootermopsis nevadensis TaxID=136037 RepID=UPI000B8E5C57|nr:aldose reductase-like isoform X2 [Zootermopsis nevadensis]